ncbi:alpha/beta hydrolase [Phyllobacterium sp. CCNWLW109]|uniref:alpha/beta hydrolase n=1 Tax=Phyllobacterium sp. CCNWLW109 TaxID=3127479 RepID=UPI0030770D7C
MSSTSINNSVIVFSEHRIPSDTPGIDLYLRNKRLHGHEVFTAEKTIVMVHGATFSSGSLYDVPLGGLSFMDYLATAGYDVFAVDVRGYGLSTKPEAMEVEANLNPPLVNTDTGVADFTAAVNFVLRHRGLTKVNIFGMSWGGTVAGAFAARNQDKVVKLALLAPQWLSDKPIPIDGGGHLDSYRLVPVLDSKARWLSTAPEHARDGLVPEGWFEQWAQFSLAEDRWSAERAPNKLRATNGPIQDIRDYWRAGKPYYQPSDITAPTLLLHGEWDIDVTIDLALAYFKELRSAQYRLWVEIGESTHLVLMEKNRLLAFKSIRDFYGQEFSPG